MLTTDPLIFSTLLFALLGLAFLVLAAVAIKERKILSTTLNFATALLMLSLSALAGTVSIAVQGYRAFTMEELAAIVDIEQTGEQKFKARFSLPDGEKKIFSLSGDQLYIDAHILKWKPWANIFGFHTSYELDRVAGRYEILRDEATKVHTVYSLSQDRPVNIFELRRRFAFLDPLLDVEYGSATFIDSESAAQYRVMVSTTGLLIRKSEKITGLEQEL